MTENQNLDSESFFIEPEIIGVKIKSTTKVTCLDLGSCPQLDKSTKDSMG